MTNAMGSELVQPLERQTLGANACGSNPGVNLKTTWQTQAMSTSWRGLPKDRSALRFSGSLSVLHR